MRNYTDTSNAILLFNIMQGLLEIHEGVKEGVNHFHELRADKQRFYHDMVDSALTVKSIGDWYDLYWRAFPFGVPFWQNLNISQRDVVEIPFETISLMAVQYGRQARID